MPFKITSTDFSEGETIPKKFTCEGSDISPELSWSGLPDGTKGLALICEDPDAPMGTFIHWVVYDIPADTTAFERGIKLAGGIRTGITGFSKTGYNGPCPPKGHGTHRYFFILRSLNTETLGLPQGASKAEVEKAMKGKVLGETKIMGVYKR